MDVNGKKVTVKFYLNQDVKGRRLKIGEGVMFPLYVRVTYNRKTTRFPLANNWFPKKNEENLEDIKELKTFKTIIEKVIAFEVNRVGESYQISGLGDRMKTFSSTLRTGIEGLLNEALSKVMEDKLTFAEYNRWQEKTLFNRVVETIKTFELEIPKNLRLLLLSFAALSNAPGILIYSWLIGEERKVILQKINDAMNDLLNVQKQSFIAFGEVTMNSMEELEELIKYLDSVCLELLDRGYSEHIDVKNIEFITE